MATLPPDQLRIIRAKLITNSGQPTIENIVSVLRETIPTITKTQLISNADTILANTSGLGLIDELVQTPNVTDVLVNGFADIWFDRGNGLEKSSVAWNSETELREFAARLAASVNRRLDDVNPFIDAQLPNGIRFHAIIPPLSRQGTLLSFRIPARHQMRLNELIQVGTIDSNIAELLKRLVQLRISFAISGNTGSGKTTILGALLSEVPQHERILIIEDSTELQVTHPHVISLQTRNANAEGIGGVELKQLVKQALRMRPDRLVIGEVRGTEVLDLLIALNTGHEGGCVTVHANNTEAVLARFEALGLLARIPKAAIHALLKQAIRVLLHVERTESGRQLTEISLIEETANGDLKILKALDLIKKQQFQPGWQRLQKLLEL
jgi:pilus assembly protein CpaF